MAPPRGRSSAAEHQLPKLRTRVRFSSPAPTKALVAAPLLESHSRTRVRFSSWQGVFGHVKASNGNPHKRRTSTLATAGHRQQCPQLWRLTARDCDALYTELKAAGLGPSRVRCTHVVLHRAVAQAVRWGWIPRNPVGDATRPDVPRTAISPPDPATVRSLLALAAATDPMLAWWLHVAVATGAAAARCAASSGATSTSTNAACASSDRSRPPGQPGSSSSPPKPEPSAESLSPPKPSPRYTTTASAPRAPPPPASRLPIGILAVSGPAVDTHLRHVESDLGVIVPTLSRLLPGRGSVEGRSINPS